MGWFTNLLSRKVAQDAPAQPAPTHALDAAGEVSYGPGGRVAYDGIVNWMTGQGGANDPATANQWMMAATQNWLALMNIHRSSWIAKKIIDKKPSDMLRAGWDQIWEGSGEKKGGEQTQADQLRQSAMRFGLDAKILEAMKWARLFGGSVIVIGIKGQLLTDPLPIKNGAVDYSGIKKNGLAFLKVYDRWRAAHDGVIDDKMQAPDGSENPNCGKPEFHVLSADGGLMGQRVHWSRVIRFDGAIIPWWNWRANGSWHDSVLQVLIDQLGQYESMTGAITSLVPKALRTIIMAKGLVKELAEDPGSISARYAATERMASMWKVSLYDMDKEKVEQQTFNFAGLDKIWEKGMKESAGGSGYPVSVLFGDEPAGMNATGDASQRNYYDDISAARESELKPAHLVLLECIARHEFGYLPPGFSIQYRPLWQASDLEKSTINKNMADADHIRLDDGVVSVELIARELKERSVYTTMTQADVDQVAELREAAEEEAASEAASAQNEPPPEVPPKGGKPGGETPAVPEPTAKATDEFNPDQPRAENGQWGEGGGASSAGSKSGEPSKEILDALNKREMRIATWPNEHVFGLKNDGTVICSKNGERNKVEFDPKEVAQFTDGHFTHNHPSGGSLSTPDLNIAVQANMASMRAVGVDPNSGFIYVHSFTRPASGWPNEGQMQDVLHRIGLVDNSLKEELGSRVSQMVPRDYQAAKIMLPHERWQIIQKTVDIGYNRERL